VKTFLRPGSIRIYSSKEGNGHKISMEDYPFQGLDIAAESYDYPWLGGARFAAMIARDGKRSVSDTVRAGNLKHFESTPLGTSVATLCREGHDMLAAPCGYCSRTGCLGACRAAGDVSE